MKILKIKETKPAHEGIRVQMPNQALYETYNQATLPIWYKIKNETADQGWETWNRIGEEIRSQIRKIL